MDNKSKITIPNIKIFSQLNKLTNKQALVLLVVLIFVVYLILSYTPLNPYLLVKYPSSKWQAVFLTNDQVYFGKVTVSNNSYVTLEHVYYLKSVNWPLQRSIITGAEIAPEQSLKLIKLSTENFSPQDKMVINKDHILFIENLNGDSNIVLAIDRYLD
ncbi:hypothetical protein KKA15_05235 [Patescibacteria group bacterium]|nr:hypothetical protein [Patescibacteria group bacterium]